jgi:hypothetical protein
LTAVYSVLRLVNIYPPNQVTDKNCVPLLCPTKVGKQALGTQVPVPYYPQHPRIHTSYIIMAAIRQSLRSTNRLTSSFLSTSRTPIRQSVRVRSMASVATATAPAHEGEKPFFPDEPAGPSLVTSIPGPKSKAAAERLNKIFDTRALNLMTDYSKSYGN